MSLTIATLLEAAEYLDRREREAEHGYASSHVPTAYDLDENTSTSSSSGGGGGGGKRSSSSNKFKKSQGNRTTHNELEKNRRAHLRGCLERLKELVPLGGESNRHTTLGLLNKAKGFIRNLEDRDKKSKFQKDQLVREQRYLLRRLDQLSENVGLTTTNSNTNTSAHRIRSISESSSGISSASTSPTSEDSEYESACFREFDSSSQ